jgi:hypothetical protein
LGFEQRRNSEEEGVGGVGVGVGVGRGANQSLGFAAELEPSLTIIKNYILAIWISLLCL